MELGSGDKPYSGVYQVFRVGDIVGFRRLTLEHRLTAFLLEAAVGTAWGQGEAWPFCDPAKLEHKLLCHVSLHPSPISYRASESST